MTEAAILLGIVSSFLYTELTGYFAGGLVGSGYLALFLGQPSRLAATFAIAAASRFLVGFLSKRMIIYGRRRFMALVLTGMALSWAWETLAGFVPSSDLDLRAIGFIVPGLIANDMWKQGCGKTILSSLFVAAAVRSILALLA
ncbi:MAG: CapC protein [Spirochaetes bacterium]|nr:MAG: CapC protein [Spirochaetota bacterium]